MLGEGSGLGSCPLEPNDVYLIQEHLSARTTLNLSPMTDGSEFLGLPVTFFYLFFYVCVLGLNLGSHAC